MAESSMRKTPESDDDTTDRLSALPDCVLLRILSRFNTKEDAVTSVLSSRWRHLFLSKTTINLNFCVNGDASEVHRLFDLFIRFAIRVLGQQNKAPIRGIRLCVCHFVESFRLGFESLLMFIAVALSTYRILHIEVLVRMDKTTGPCCVTIPPGMFLSETLDGLRLDLSVGWNVPEFVLFSNLKDLHLLSFRLVDEYSVQRLLQGCPSLDSLVLNMGSLNESEEGMEVQALRVSSSSLKYLMLSWDERVESEFNVFVESDSLETLLLSLDGRHKVTLDSPNMKFLLISGNVLSLHIIQSFFFIEDVVIETKFPFHVQDDDELSSRAQYASNFFTELQDVRSLSLSEDFMQVCFFCYLCLIGLSKVLN